MSAGEDDRQAEYDEKAAAVLYGPGVPRENLRPQVHLLATSAEHSRVKLKRLGIPEFNPPELGMRWIQENVPFAPDSRGRNQQAYGVASADPLVSEATQRLIPACIPMRRQNLRTQSRDLDAFRDVSFDRDEVGRAEIRFEIDESLNRCKRKRN